MPNLSLTKKCVSRASCKVVKQHEEDGTRHIFFDDNIERTLAHIVDCRSAKIAIW